MIKLSKKVEYALLALQYMGARAPDLVSAKEMSESLNISFEFLSKTLQTLMKGGFVMSHQGIKGGYTLIKKPEDINIASVILALDMKHGIVECMINEDNESCFRVEECSIRKPMARLQKKIDDIFYKTTISELS